MLQAKNKVLLALYAVSTLFSLIQPREAFASQPAETQATTGQREAVTNTLQARNESVQDFSMNLPSVKIASFEEKSDFVYALRTRPESFSDAHTTQYAVSNVAEEASTKAATTVVSEQTIEVAYVTPAQTVASVATKPDTENYQLNADLLFNLVNQHRASIGLVQVQKDERVMQVARERAPELFDEIFVNGNMHAGFNARKLSYPASEIIIYYNTEEGAMQWWLNSPIHRSIIQNGTYTHAGIACSGKSCTMIFATL